MDGRGFAIFSKISKTNIVITQDQEFSQDTLTALLCEVQSVIKQRSLTPTSDSIDDFDVIRISVSLTIVESTIWKFQTTRFDI